MKYKVGDKVLIRSDLMCDRHYGKGELFFHPDMKLLIGATVEIYSVYEMFGETRYKIKGFSWVLNNEMIERKLEEEKMFTKDDLKVGYVVEKRNEKLYLIMPVEDGMLYTIGKKEGDGLWNYDENLKNTVESHGENELDIMKVYGYCGTFINAADISTVGRKLLWERKESPIELTIEEIAKKYGVSAERIRIKE